MFSEETDETKKFEAFLADEYGLDEVAAGLDVWGIQGEIRCNGATVTNALEYIRDQCDWAPDDYADVELLVRAISPVVGVTRTWEYRGHTQKEMFRLGLIDKYSCEDIPDVFGLADDDDDDDYDYGDVIRLEDLPKPAYNGPIDFRFVKDSARREAKMSVYDDVRQIMDEFARKYLTKESTPERIVEAAVRLGYLKQGAGIEKLSHDHFLTTVDFLSVIDDADGGPSVRRIAKRKDELDGYDRLALEYFSNARYTWLVIDAVKAGCGMKCRDLMAGEELFLIDRSGSVGDIKGRTLCTGIVPMGDVYLSTGSGTLVYLKDPAAELGKVLSQLRMPDERPVRLSFREQARFFETTVRHLQPVMGRV